jgi:Na+/H+ antiporter NhaA
MRHSDQGPNILESEAAAGLEWLVNFVRRSQTVSAVFLCLQHQTVNRVTELVVPSVLLWVSVRVRESGLHMTRDGTLPI